MNFMNCTREGCNGLMELQGGDIRSKKRVYKCEICGKIEEIKSSNVDASKYTFMLNDPRDPLRGGLK